jgi:hypothetical protein
LRQTVEHLQLEKEVFLEEKRQFEEEIKQRNEDLHKLNERLFLKDLDNSLKMDKQGSVAEEKLTQLKDANIRRQADVVKLRSKLQTLK